MLFIAWNKVLPLVVLPLMASLLVLSVGLRFKRRILAVFGLAILALLGTPAFANLLLRSLEDSYPYISLDDSPKADAVFVFGGMLGARDRSDGGIAWNEAAERFDRAVQTLKTGKAALLVLSGGAERISSSAEDEGHLLAMEAVKRGVPRDKILLTESTENTEEEARALCRLTKLHKWQRVLVVTSAFHMTRAMYLCQACSTSLMPIPVAFETPAPGTTWASRRPEYWIPQAEGLFRSERALREYLGIIVIATRI